MSSSPETPFRDGDQKLAFNLLDFWRWSSSELLSNALRGVLAEFLVGQALGALTEGRTEWDAYDLQTPEGTKVEVKSAAYLQSWPQKELSKISFGIAPTLGWDAKSNTYSPERRRQADMYVFCLLEHDDPDTVDPMDLLQWRFWVVPTTVLAERFGDQKTVSLGPLVGLAGEGVRYGFLKSAVDAARRG